MFVLWNGINEFHSLLGFPVDCFCILFRIQTKRWSVLKVKTGNAGVQGECEESDMRLFVLSFPHVPDGPFTRDPHTGQLNQNFGAHGRALAVSKVPEMILVASCRWALPTLKWVLPASGAL